MKVMITGGSGRLGKELRRVYPQSIAYRSQELDVADSEKVSKLVAITNPGLVIHCAALTGILACENNRTRAFNVNVVGTRNLVTACKSLQSEPDFVFVSTPCVFSGFEGNYDEDSIPYPQNFYGMSKLMSEYEITKSHLNHWLIVRCNFAPREPWPYPKAFDDRFGTYLFADTLASALKSVIGKGFQGVLHVCGDRRMSMFDLARITTPNIVPMSMNEYTGPHLTRDMTLTSKRISQFKFC